MFRTLDATCIVATAGRLKRRIEERFPESSLARIGAELEEVAREAAALSEWLARPNLRLRAGVGLSILVLLASVVSAVFFVQGRGGPKNWADWAQSLEALVNDVVFIGVAFYFLLGLEVRQKRRRAQEALHVLRSMAHIVDMHQLTKDPEAMIGPTTPSSPERRMAPFELARYLDYSSELLALISKVAALYVQELNDPVTVQAAGDVEQLAVNLSRTIWQKLVILDRMAGATATEAARETVISPRGL